MSNYSKIVELEKQIKKLKQGDTKELVQIRKLVSSEQVKSLIRKYKKPIHVHFKLSDDLEFTGDVVVDVFNECVLYPRTYKDSISFLHISDDKTFQILNATVDTEEFIEEVSDIMYKNTRHLLKNIQEFNKEILKMAKDHNIQDTQELIDQLDSKYEFGV